MPGLWVKRYASQVCLFSCTKARKILIFWLGAEEGTASHGNVKKQESEDIYE